MAKINLTVTVDLDESLTQAELDHIASELVCDLSAVACRSYDLRRKQGVNVTARVITDEELAIVSLISGRGNY